MYLACSQYNDSQPTGNAHSTDLYADRPYVHGSDRNNYHYFRHRGIDIQPGWFTLCSLSGRRLHRCNQRPSYDHSTERGGMYFAGSQYNDSQPTGNTSRADFYADRPYLYDSHGNNYDYFGYCRTDL